MNSHSALTEEQQKLVCQIGFEDHCDPIFIMNRQWRILQTNRAFAEITGIKLDECISANVNDILFNDLNGKICKYAEEAFRTGQLQVFEAETGSGFFRYSINPVKEADDSIEILYIYLHDITKTKLSELKTKKHAAFTREAMEAFPGAFTVLDSNGKIISCNSYFRNLIAKTDNDDLSGISTFDLFHPDDQPFAFQKLEQILLNGTEETAELRVKLYGGTEYRWFRISTKRLIVDNEIFLVSAGTDIEQYKKKEQQLSLSNEQLRLILSESKTGSWDWDIETNTNTWSDEIWELYGLDHSACESSYENWKNAIFEKDRNNSELKVSEASKKGVPFRIEWRVRHPDGSLHWLMSRGIPFRNASGVVSRYIGIVIDITDLKETELQLKKSEEQFRYFFEQHSAAMMILDPETGNIVDVNQAASDIYGWSREQLRRMDVIGLNTDVPEISRARLDKWKNTEKRTFIVTHRKADGSIFDIEVYGKKVLVQDRWLAFLILHDITEQKKFQQALVEGNERMHFILNAAKAGIWDADTITNEINWSDELWHLHGIEPRSFPLTYESMIATIIPEDRPSFEQAMAGAINNTTEFNVSWRIKDANDNILWLMGKGNPVTNADGKVVKYVGITLDITGQKRLEDEKMLLETRIRRSERLESLGNLAGGIAHDFNNILTPILNYAEMGMLKLPENEPLYRYFKEITLAAERARNLVFQILTFSKAREIESINVSVQSIIEEALKLLRPSIPVTISIEKRINAACRNISADPSKIYQVIINLCTNAWQAMEEREGELLIELDELTPDPSLLKRFPELHEQPYVRLSVSDTGRGMDIRTLDHIFEPFFTTKPVNKGTGLGLSVVHGIITGYHGVIEVDSVPGKGSTFRIYLPVSQKTTGIKEQKTNIKGRPLSILLVDDEKVILEVTGMMLTHFGHKVCAQNSPRKALELLRQSPGEFDVVITDLTMQEMTGVKLALEIYPCRNDLPVILMTGYEQAIDSANETGMKNIVKILKKPVRFETLLSAINEATGKNGTTS